MTHNIYCYVLACSVVSYTLYYVHHCGMGWRCLLYCDHTDCRVLCCIVQSVEVAVQVLVDGCAAAEALTRKDEVCYHIISYQPLNMTAHQLLHVTTLHTKWMIYRCLCSLCGSASDIRRQLLHNSTIHICVYLGLERVVMFMWYRH